MLGIVASKCVFTVTVCLSVGFTLLNGVISEATAGESTPLDSVLKFSANLWVQGPDLCIFEMETEWLLMLCSRFAADSEQVIHERCTPI